MRRRSLVCSVFVGIVAASPCFAQSPSAELDQNWINVCADAVPGTPFHARCQEILNAGPGSGNRRSSAATGNNLETVGAAGRMRATDDEAARFELKEGRTNLFVSANSGWSARPASDREHGFDAVNQTLLAGLDYLVSSAAVAGIGLSYSAHGVDFDASVGDLESQRVGVTGFWSQALPLAAALDARVGYARTDHDVVRNIDYLIVLNSGQPTEETRRITSVARADVRGHQTLAASDLTFDVPVRAFTLMPRAGIEWIRTAIDGYAETDAAGLAMAYDRQVMRSLVLGAGLSANVAMSRDWGVLTWQASADFRHEYADDERDISGRFVQDPSGYRLDIPTDAPDRDFFLVGGGIVAVLPGGFSGFLSLQGTMGHTQFRDQLFSAGLRARL